MKLKLLVFTFLLGSTMCFAKKTFEPKKTLKKTYEKYETGGGQNGYEIANYSQNAHSNGDVDHFMNCANPGSKDCCWPAQAFCRTTIVTHNQYQCDINDIYSYVLNQIANGYTTGNELYAGEIPVIWNVEENGSYRILVESDEKECN